MKTRNYITFAADFPDDTCWDEQRAPVVAGGGAISRHLAASLAVTGFQCSIPEPHSFYGWAFEAEARASKSWCLLQFVDPWLLLVEPRSGTIGRWFRRLIARRESVRCHHEVVAALVAVLQSDERFSEIRQWTKAEFESRTGTPRN